MGWIRHHAIVVTTAGYNFPPLRAAADAVFGPGACPIAGPGINNHATLLVPPDGSKEGWEESDVGDKARDKFVAWLQSEAYEDGSSPYSWVEVEYAETRPKITRQGGNHDG